MNDMESPSFLKKFPGLGASPEVLKAKARTERRSGAKVSGSFESLIQNYLNRFTEFKDRLNTTKDGKPKERAIQRFKDIILDKFITKYENIPPTYWSEKDEEGNMGSFFREINDLGLGGDWEAMSEEEKEKYKQTHAEILIENQKGSLEEWLDYFLDDDLSGDIPDYLKYWIFRSLTHLQEYEKPRHQFPRRSKNSLKNYPDLNPEALRYVSEAITNKHQGKEHEFDYDIEPDEQQKFLQYLEQENFAKLYAWAMESFNPIPEELLPITDGQWVTYPQGSDFVEVSKKLKGRGTGLCIAGKGAAHRYLKSGDLHIFYSNDEDGNPTFPRIALHAKGNHIAEMRGIAYKQNLDPYMNDIASAKCKEFKNGAEYQHKSAHMKLLTEIEDKVRQKQLLSKDELVFLYEIDEPIDYFGMREDPRIKHIRSQRNIEEDILVIFDCTRDQIAQNVEQVNENTRAYVGEWNIDVFQKIRNYPNIKHLYESFPDKKIFMQTLETDPAINSSESAEEVMERKNIYRSDWSKDILYKTEFSKEAQRYELVGFTVAQLGFPNGATTDQIYKKIEDLGLELCPAEVGPHLRLQYSGKEWMLIAMEQITDRGGFPSVFYLRTDGAQLGLDGGSVKPSFKWSSVDRFVFRFRKPADEAGKLDT